MKVITYPVRQYTDKEINEFLAEDKKINPKILNKLQDDLDSAWIAKNENKLKNSKGKTEKEISKKYEL